MTDNQNGASTSTFPAAPGAYGNMTDTQLRQAISHITSAAQATYASPAPRPADPKAYMKNVHTWSTATTPPPKTPASAARNTRARQTRAANVYTPSAAYTPPVYQPPLPVAAVSVAQPNPPRPPLPTTPQALQSTYAPRLRTGTTLLMQPILSSATTTHSRVATRRGGVVNYADPGSGDEFPDAGALDSDDSDFIASGGTRTAIRQSRSRTGAGVAVFNSAVGSSATPNRIGTPQMEKNELDQSYLGQIPPERFIKPRPMQQTVHDYPAPDALLKQGQKRTSLIPIRVEFETDTHRIRDCFVWNVNEELIKPETFAKIFCYDLDLPVTLSETVAAQIRAQIEEHEGVASMELGQDGALDLDELGQNGDELPDCRVILSIDVQIANHHLMDHIEWDLLSPLTPEAFAQKLCMELGLSGEAIPLVAHAVHEELMKHKKDAIEWGVIGGEREIGEDGVGGDRPRDKSGFGLVKDKTGLGLGWGRAPKDGRGPKTLKSVWRDWQEAEEFRTKFEELTAEEVERREIERERASRRLRRETSKFQSTRSRRR
ncbi:SNF5-domain-containing protein [Macrolepiota fuliginosa MF-IS2]|uniref:SNF5-domain-containing protein n=1 Tax=Macrolepiota fuliginosa MF-IS2 TaxID=1400762 RepID=A0A9P5XNR2_9AGAR|nr:SNF5-domain-containing protein [Macrolepiota fuliginosa MF-IS2]